MGVYGGQLWLRRQLEWRYPLRWWLFPLLGIPRLDFLAAMGHWLTDTADALSGWNRSFAYFLGSTVARASAGPSPTVPPPRLTMAVPCSSGDSRRQPRAKTIH